ncbi:MAG: exonuclease SbcCD subunit D [Candidatus Limnocylindria bacterium]
MSFRFLHLADLHLETRFGGRPDTRERLRRATCEAFERAVDHALEHQLHALLAAGDLFDDEILSVRTELFFAKQLARLAQAGVWFVAACGNHDPGGSGFRTAALGALGERVQFFRGGEPRALQVTSREGVPVGVVIGAGHESAHESSNLAARFPPTPGPLPVVGLLHTSVESAKSAAEHDRYAPSTRADYERLPYSYWALGHIHLRQQAVAGLPVHYAGNLQGRHAGETGEKGGLLVEAFPGASAEPRFVPFAPVRWERAAVGGLAAVTSMDALAGELARRVEALPRAAGEQLALRLELEGETPLAGELRSEPSLVSLAEEVAMRSCALELELRADRTSLPFDRARLRASPNVVATALELIERARADDALLAALVPAELAHPAGEGETRLAYLRQLLEELPEELLLRGVEPGGA